MSESSQNIGLEQNFQADGDDVVEMELEVPDGIGPGLEAELSYCVEQNSGDDEREGYGAHGVFLM